MMQGCAKWLAHSARAQPSIPAQGYGEHVAAVVRNTVRSLEQAGRFAAGPTTAETLRITGTRAAIFHDLGKLEDSNQATLRSQEAKSLGYSHESAGALHCLERGQRKAAWLIHSHHQGLTNNSAELALQNRGREAIPAGPS